MIETCEIFCEGRTYRFKIRMPHTLTGDARQIRRDWIDGQSWHTAVWYRGEPYTFENDEGFRELAWDDCALFIRYEDAFLYLVTFSGITA